MGDGGRIREVPYLVAASPHFGVNLKLADRCTEAMFVVSGGCSITDVYWDLGIGTGWLDFGSLVGRVIGKIESSLEEIPENFAERNIFAVVSDCHVWSIPRRRIFHVSEHLLLEIVSMSRIRFRKMYLRYVTEIPARHYNIPKCGEQVRSN